MRRPLRRCARQGQERHPGGRTVWTLERLWSHYIAYEQDKAIARADRSNIKHLAPLMGKSVRSLTAAHVEDLKQRLQSTPSQRNSRHCLTPQTVKHVLGLLLRMLRFGVRRGYFEFPPKLHIVMPRVDNAKTECMTSEQLQRYLSALGQERDAVAAAYLRMALLTGMRKGALLALQWRDIDFERGHITLRGEAAKSGRTSHIPLTPPVRDLLQHLPRTGSVYVFPGRNGGRRYDFRRVAQRVRDRAGLPGDFRPVHGLRHTYASFLASSGKVDLYTLQRLLTHHSPQMTQRYAHLADEALAKAASVMTEEIALGVATQEATPEDGTGYTRLCPSMRCRNP